MTSLIRSRVRSTCLVLLSLLSCPILGYQIGRTVPPYARRLVQGPPRLYQWESTNAGDRGYNNWEAARNSGPVPPHLNDANALATTTHHQHDGSMEGQEPPFQRHRLLESQDELFHRHPSLNGQQDEPFQRYPSLDGQQEEAFHQDHFRHPQQQQHQQQRPSIGTQYLNQISNIFSEEDPRGNNQHQYHEPPQQQHQQQQHHQHQRNDEPADWDQSNQNEAPDMTRLPLVNIDHLYLPFFNDARAEENVNEGEANADEIEQELDQNIHDYVEQREREKRLRNLRFEPRNRKHDISEDEPEEDESEDENEHSDKRNANNEELEDYPMVIRYHNNGSHPRSRTVQKRIRPRISKPFRPNPERGSSRPPSTRPSDNRPYPSNPLEDDNIRVHVYGSYKRPAPPSGSHTSTLVPNYGPAPDPRRSVVTDDEDDDESESPSVPLIPGQAAPPIHSQVSRVYNQPEQRRRKPPTHSQRVRPEKRNLTPQAKYDRQIQNGGDDNDDEDSDNDSNEDKKKQQAEDKPEITVNNHQPQFPPNTNYPAFPLHFPTFNPRPQQSPGGLFVHQIPPSAKPLVIVPINKIPGLTTTTLDQSQEPRSLVYGGGGGGGGVGAGALGGGHHLPHHHHQPQLHPALSSKKSHHHYGPSRHGRANIKAYRGPSQKLKSSHGYASYFAPWGYSSYVPTDSKPKKKY